MIKGKPKDTRQLNAAPQAAWLQSAPQESSTSCWRSRMVVSESELLSASARAAGYTAARRVYRTTTATALLLLSVCHVSELESDGRDSDVTTWSHDSESRQRPGRLRAAHRLSISVLHSTPAGHRRAGRRRRATRSALPSMPSTLTTANRLQTRHKARLLYPHHHSQRSPLVTTTFTVHSHYCGRSCQSTAAVIHEYRNPSSVRTTCP